MEHEGLLKRHFDFGDAEGWTALAVKNGRRLEAFKTSRIAKVQDGVLYFTIGETQHGKEIGLGDLIRDAITTAGLVVRETPTTAGNRREDRIYPGFELETCPAEVVERIIAHVMTRVDGTTSAEASHDENEVLEQFRLAMLGIYDAALELDPPYRPTKFRRMVNEIGAKETADILLASANPSEGFGTLLLRGKDSLKLSVEYLVLVHPWRTLFEPEQLAVARKRLIDVGCEPPPEGEVSEPKDSPLAEEIPVNATFVEGAVRQVTINAYERNPVARVRCLAHYGPTCLACGMNFGAVYGPLAKGFIHVHHIKKLAEIGEEYEVDPIGDLRPVCPNCHAVIHLDGGCRTIDEVKQLLAAAKQL